MASTLDLPSFDTPPTQHASPRAIRPAPSHYRTSRRAFMRGAVVAGGALGLSILSRVPFVREAEASGHCRASSHRDIRSGCYASYDYGCSACGPSPVVSAACNSNGWHKYTGDYRNRPNQCPLGTSWDGWTWFEYGCGCPSGTGRRYRCHDGCRRLSDGSWGNSVCRWPVSICFG